MNRIEFQVEAFKAALLRIDRIGAADIFEKCYLENNSFEELEDLTMKSLEKIGAGWEEGRLSLSQVYMGGIICEDLINRYLPKFDMSYKTKPKMGIGVLQDHHSLGKRIIYSVLRSGGYELIDLGDGLSVGDMVEKTLHNDIEVLLISTLMLPSALLVEKVVTSLREKGSTAKVVVGGAPFRLDEKLWKKVKADADGKNGMEVAGIIEGLIRGESY